jgi:hypothetical protein
MASWEEGNFMKNRSVTHLLYAESYDMGGLPIRQPFPTNNVERIDPFLLLHHADVKVPHILLRITRVLDLILIADFLQLHLFLKVVFIIAIAGEITV